LGILLRILLLSSSSLFALWYVMGSDAMEAAFCADIAKVVAGWEALLVRHGFAVVEEKK